MTEKEYLSNLPQIPINDGKVKVIEDIYNCQLPDILKRIISQADQTMFFDDGSRILSYQEILDANENLHVNFTGEGIIPIADCEDNDFIVYHIKNGRWSKFNIVDGSVFKERDSLDELLK